MLTFENFAGINNVLPSERLSSSELTAALNVDIGLSGEILRRDGYSTSIPVCHDNLWQADDFLLATRRCGELVAIRGTTETTLHPALGETRVWYVNLPDGRVAFSNGLINGITDGSTITDWGVPLLPGLGQLTEVQGQLDPGDYQYQLTYVRLSDGLEGAPVFSDPAPVKDGGILLTALPTRQGYKINVYLTSANGDHAYFAGETMGHSFAYMGGNDALTLPCRTENLLPAPKGTVMAFWRGRVLVAEGNVLHASRTNQWELFDARRDFKQFSAPITLVQPVDDGVYVGTEAELVFMAGVEWDKLAYRQVVDGPVVLGSGVSVRGERVKQGKQPGTGTAMICIADRMLVAGFNGGQLELLTQGRYHTDVKEVCATFREVRGIPQYVAVPL